MRCGGAKVSTSQSFGGEAALGLGWFPSCVPLVGRDEWVFWRFGGCRRNTCASSATPTSVRNHKDYSVLHDGRS